MGPESPLVTYRPAPYLSAGATNRVDWLWPVVYGSTCAHKDVAAHVPTQIFLKQNYREFSNLGKLQCFESVGCSICFEHFVVLLGSGVKERVK